MKNISASITHFITVALLDFGATLILSFVGAKFVTNLDTLLIGVYVLLVPVFYLIVRHSVKFLKGTIVGFDANKVLYGSTLLYVLFKILTDIQLEEVVDPLSIVEAVSFALLFFIFTRHFLDKK